MEIPERISYYGVVKTVSTQKVYNMKNINDKNGNLITGGKNHGKVEVIFCWDSGGRATALRRR